MVHHRLGLQAHADLAPVSDYELYDLEKSLVCLSLGFLNVGSLVVPPL